MANAALTRIDQEGFAAFLLRLRAMGLDNRALTEAIEATPRRSFVDPEHHAVAWGPRSIPIECGTVLEGLDQQAQLIDALDIEPAHRVLEVGTGSGYTAAIMGRLAKRVITIERFAGLQQAANVRLGQLKRETVVALRGDGTRDIGDGPFDRIIIWPAVPAIPRHYGDLLVSGGKLVCAVGEADQAQIVVALTKVGSRFDRHDIGTARFAPITPGLPEAL